MRVIAALSDPAVVAKVLAHLDLPTALPCTGPRAALKATAPVTVKAGEDAQVSVQF
jgi:hypothetical protein